MIESHHVVEHAKSKAFLRLEQLVQVTRAIVSEFEQKVLLMAAVGDVPNQTRQEMAVGAWHRFFP